MAGIDPHQFPTARSSGVFGADEVPSRDAAVFAFLELVAGAFIFGAVDALVNGASWRVYVLLFACGTLFFLIGIKTHWIRSKFTSVDWVLWIKRIDRALRVAFVLVLISLMASGYFAYREASLLWRDVLGHIQFASKEQIPKSPDAPAAPKLPNALAVPKSPSTKHVDWHNQHNWRGNLRIGMTETEVYRLFGEPEQIQVTGDFEIWRYGSGDVSFTAGALDSWDEPLQ